MAQHKVKVYQDLVKINPAYWRWETVVYCPNCKRELIGGLGFPMSVGIATEHARNCHE